MDLQYLPPNPVLRPVKSTAFKREERRKRKERKRQQKLEERVEEQLQSLIIPTSKPDPVVFSDIEWPCRSIPDPNPEPTGWARPNSDPNPEPTGCGWALQNANTNPVPAYFFEEEQVRAAAGPQAQQNALRASQEFFSKNDNDEEDEEEEEEEEDENLKFFEGLFENGGELRGFYEKNWEKGEFACLVCGGIREKSGKRFSGCAGLVQHANTVWKTRRRGAHRALGKVLCRVLGWDINRLPGTSLDEPQVQKDSGIIEQNELEEETGELDETYKEDMMEEETTN